MTHVVPGQGPRGRSWPEPPRRAGVRPPVRSSTFTSAGGSHRRWQAQAAGTAWGIVALRKRRSAIRGASTARSVLVKVAERMPHYQHLTGRSERLHVKWRTRWLAHGASTMRRLAEWRRFRRTPTTPHTGPTTAQLTGPNRVEPLRTIPAAKPGHGQLPAAVACNLAAVAVTLEEITDQNREAVLALRVAPGQ